MSGLGVVECLRPLVETNAWDFGIVWNYGDDPTRFIEWMGCCCRGSCNENIEVVKLKDEEMDEQYNNSVPICRDTQFQHPVRTKACQALSQLPFAMSLYSGVHGEVAISQQPRWFTQEETGTQVLIPILGGLIELFAAKHIPKDLSMIEFITAHCCVSLKQEAISAQSYTTMNFNEQLQSEEQQTQSWPQFTSAMNAANWFNSHPYIEGTSSGSNPSNEYTSFNSDFVCFAQHGYLEQSVKTSPTSKTKRSNYNETSGKQQRSLSSHCENDKEGKRKLVRDPQKEGCHAKNLATERKRRNRIKNGLYTLRSLVPKITKMDRASILADAMDYIKELQGQVKELNDEARALEEDDSENNTPQSMTPTDKEHGGIRSLPLTELNESSSNCAKLMDMKVQAEVNHMSGTELLIKVYCNPKLGGFSRLMEAIHSFGLQVENANMTTLDGRAQIILTVEAAKQNIQPKELIEYLTEKTGQ